MPLDYLQFATFGMVQEAQALQCLEAAVSQLSAQGVIGAGQAELLHFTAETDLKAALEHATTTHFVVFHDRAEAAVARAAQQHCPPQETLLHWQEVARGLLRVYRKHRRRIILVDVAAFCQNPQMFVSTLAQFLKIDVSNIGAMPGSDVVSDPVCQVIAVQAVQQSPLATRLNGELAAGSLPFGGTDAHAKADADQAFHMYQELEGAKQALKARFLALDEAAEKKQASFDKIQEEEADLRQHLIESQAALEQRWAQVQTLEAVQDTVASLTQEVDRLKGERASLEAALGEQTRRAKEFERRSLRSAQLQRENELQQVQLMAVQSEVETHYMDVVSLRKKRRDLEKKLGELSHDLTAKLQVANEELQQALIDLGMRDEQLAEANHQNAHLQEQLQIREDELRQVLNSNAWKVTGPLRHAKDSLLKRGRQED